MKDYTEQIHEYALSHRDEIASTLAKLVQFPSIADTEGAKQVMEYVNSLFSENGFEVEAHDSYSLASFGNAPHSIGLFSHADVVPAGDDWTICAPFEGKLVGDDIFGRGSSDDKSAIVTSLYALKAIKELGIELNSSLLCFIGANEETTMSDIIDYKKSHTPPDISLVLDSGFPIHLGDKGMLWCECERNAPLDDLFELYGGEAVNITLKGACAKVRYSEGLFDELSKAEDISLEKTGSYITIRAEGISAHGATPQGTVNGACIILNALFACESFSPSDKESLSFLRDFLSVYDGSTLEIQSQDDTFGVTTATNGIVDIKGGKIKFTIDIRYGSTFTEAALIQKIDRILTEHAFTYKILKNGEPKAISADNKYVVACLDAYKKHTGNENATPRISAGGTYSRYLDSSFEIGTTTKWNSFSLPSGHGGAHQPDEHISISGLLDALEITIKMILASDQVQ